MTMLTTLPTHLENATPQDILMWAADTYQQHMVVVTSFQKTGVVTLHMLQSIAPQTPVITLDTGKLFPETVAYIDALAHQWNLNLHRVRPLQPVADDLWQTDPDRCCHLRKVVPLNQALAPFDAWVAGIRRDQSKSRAKVPVIQQDHRNMTKLAPFATWTESMIDDYMVAHQLPLNPLYSQGYTSIGCAPCTYPTQSDEHPRAGRWRGQDKTECGLHTPAD